MRIDRAIFLVGTLLLIGVSGSSCTVTSRREPGTVYVEERPASSQTVVVTQQPARGTPAPRATSTTTTTTTTTTVGRGHPHGGPPGQTGQHPHGGPPGQTGQ